MLSVLMWALPLVVSGHLQVLTPPADDILRLTGTKGPYVDRLSQGLELDPPQGCSVEQVIMVMRHGARYPTANAYPDLQGALAKLENKTFSSGPLQFFNDWTPYVDNLGWLEQETFSGPYAGLLSAYQRGTEYRARYGHLWDGESIVPFWSSDSERVIMTARHFGEGFFGYNYSTNAALNIVSEAESQGANSLTPVCHAVDPKSGDVCSNLNVKQSYPLASVAADRLNKRYGLNLTGDDVYNLQQLAVFELNVRGDSPWLDAFTRDEWVAFNYYCGLDFFYCKGPGSAGSVAAGSVVANASLSLLQQGPSEHAQAGGKMYWNFSHDSDIVPILAALGLAYPDEKDVPYNGSIAFTAKYNAVDIMPMAGHVVFERLHCTEDTPAWSAGTYVRVILNEQVLPVQDCQNGPGFSCKLEDYIARAKKRLVDYNSFCKTPDDWQKHLSFWWNPNTTQQYNYQKGPIGYQQKTTLE
uniref:ARAD1A14476p n=1 Tax=Blastobotrys adeninivorans TaxID=409370 RepID=A0A060SXP8_BLAAD